MAIQAQFPAPLEWTAENGSVNGGGGFNFFNTVEQQQQKQQLEFHSSNLQQQLLQQQQQRNNYHVFQSTNPEFEALNRWGLKGVLGSKIVQNSMPNPSLAAFEQKQRHEIDHYIRLQNERLRLMLQEQRKQHVSFFLKTIESKATAILNQKDEEITRASKRVTEMEQLMKKLEMENQAWQRIAKENEAVVISLNNTLEQVRGSSSLMVNGDDAESCCCENSNDDIIDKVRRWSPAVCRGCGSRGACVLFLPCRHLCSCNACDGFLDRCPLCLTPKKASIEALMA